MNDVNGITRSSFRDDLLSACYSRLLTWSLFCICRAVLFSSN